MSGPDLTTDEDGAVLDPSSFVIRTLGRAERPSPLNTGDGDRGFVDDLTRVPFRIADPGGDRFAGIGFEKAGPRKLLYFDPSRVVAAVVTCGGLCPGLNNVIRSIVLQLWYGYGVRTIWGARYGWAGLDERCDADPARRLKRLDPEAVGDIHRQGGSVLGTSREKLDPEAALAFLRRHDINVLFTIGGEGTHTAAHALAREAERQGYHLAVVGVPKTIDNDIPYVWRSFGYFTAIERAREVISSAHNEARSHDAGVGLVKLMGRSAGFVAAGATLASQEVNFTLVPEVPFDLDGDRGFLRALRLRLRDRRHAVVVVAEGVGRAGGVRDGGRDLGPIGDIGIFLRDRISEECRRAGLPANVKYFDPAYYIRSVPANSDDALFCDQLARCAVHAAMAGKTDLLVGYWYNVCTHVPIERVAGRSKTMKPSNEIWRSVLQTTGQAPHYGNG